MKKITLLTVLMLAFALNSIAQDWVLIDCDNVKASIYPYSGTVDQTLANPAKDGVNSSNKVAGWNRPADGYKYLNTTFSSAKKLYETPVFSIKVYCDTVGQVRINVVDNNDKAFSMSLDLGAANAWHEYNFDLSSKLSNVNYKKIEWTFNYENNKAQRIYYFDDVKFKATTLTNSDTLSLMYSDLPGYPNSYNDFNDKLNTNTNLVTANGAFTSTDTMLMNGYDTEDAKYVTYAAYYKNPSKNKHFNFVDGNAGSKANDTAVLSNVNISGFSKFLVAFGHETRTWNGPGSGPVVNSRPKVEVQVDGGSWVTLDNATAIGMWPNEDLQWSYVKLPTNISSGNSMNVRFTRGATWMSFYLDDISVLGIPLIIPPPSTPVLSGNNVRIQMASGPITIDGDTTEWANVLQVNITKSFTGDVFANAADLTGYWKAVYNDTGIFVLVNRTKDNIRYTDGKPGNNYTKDGVEVYFDANDVLKDGGYPGIANGYDGHNNGHYQVAVYNTNTSTPGLAGWCKGCKTAVKGGDTITGVNYPSVEELYVPWTTLQSKQGGAFDPGAGMPLGFDVCLIDNDGGGDGNVKRRKVWSNDGTAGENYTNMDSAGMITFKAEAAIAKATGPITIDGSDTETAWNDANKYDISLHVKGDGDFANPADLSGYWKAAYNDTGIFVTVQTTMDNIRFTGDHSTGNSWEKDGLEVYFDMNKTLLDGLGSKDSKGHYQIAIYNVNAATQSSSLPGCKLVVNGGDTTHNVNYPIKSELYVPWKSLKDKYGVSYDPRSGQSFGFDVYLLDNDGGANATPARRRLAWANDKTVDENYMNMDGAGIVKLQGFTRSKAEISKTSTQIKIDGSIDDAWSNATQYNITKPFGSDVFANAADLSGYWKALACDTGIFVLVKTTKDNIRYTGDGKTFGAPWEKDAIEVYFDVNDTLDGLGSGAGTSTGHYAFTVYNVNAETQTPPCVGCQLAVNGADTVAGSNYPITEELFVPWTYLKDKNAKLIHTDGAKLGFDVGLSDNDGGANGTPARRRLMWSNSGAIGENYSNMDDAGILVLPQLGAVQAILVSSIDISGKDTLRVNASTIMSANVLPVNATNANYTWSVSDPSLASISTRGILLGKAIGKVTVTATALDAGGITGTKTVVIIKAADTKPPILSDAAIDNITGTSAKAHVTSSENGKIYFGVMLASENSPSANVIKTGTGLSSAGNNSIVASVKQTINLSGLTAMTGYSFYVIAVDSSGNISDISRVDFSTNNATSVMSQRVSNVSIYPNPATDVIRLKNNNAEGILFIYDITGQLVLTRNLHADAEINVSALRNGLYTVMTISSNGVSTTKIIIKK